MRNAFASEITKLAGENKDIVLLSGDIGNRLFDDYKSRYQERFFNCGVAEANMIGVAAGMALSGLHPVAYTITQFITARCFEQIKLDVCYHNVPVVIAGVGSGLSYAELGSTHQSCEDIALMSILPHMAVICPGDSWEVRGALRAAIQHNGPVFIRLGKKGEPLIHQKAPDFIIGKGIVAREGHDVCLLSTGNMLPTVMGASEKLGEKGISAQVVSFHTVKPLDEDMLKEVFFRFKIVATIEEHNLIGGFGSSVANWVIDNSPQKARLLRIGTGDTFIHEAGKQKDFQRRFGLTAEAIADKIIITLNHKTGKGIQC